MAFPFSKRACPLFQFSQFCYACKYQNVDILSQVQIQCSPKGTYRGIIDCFSQIIEKEGARGLYRGLAPPLCTISLTNAVCFGTFGYVLKRCPDPSNYKSHLIAGTVTGQSLLLAFAIGILVFNICQQNLKIELLAFDNSINCWQYYQLLATTVVISSKCYQYLTVGSVSSI